MWYIYSGILLSHKRDKLMPFAATWMDVEIIILSQVRKKKTNTIWYLLIVESKIWNRRSYLKKKNNSQKQIMAKKSRLGVYKGKGKGVGWVGILGFFWMQTVIFGMWAMGSYCMAQGNVCVIGSPCCITKPDETL